MILWDVNIWVYAFRADSPMHRDSRSRMAQTLQEQVPFLFVPQIAASFLRLVTNPRIFREPSGLEEARAFAEALQSAPSSRCTPCGPGDTA